MDVDFRDRETIRDRARRLRRRVFGDTTPVPVDIEAIVYDYLYDTHEIAFYDDEELGDRGEDDVLGKTRLDERAIYVDRRLAETGHTGRYRFTVAHEIGHWVMHRPDVLERLERDAEETDELGFVTLKRDIEETGGAEEHFQPEEWQANVFAIWLLLPDEALQRAFERRFQTDVLVCPESWRDPDLDYPMRPFSRTVAAMRGHEFGPLFEQFQLSIEATAIALEERGYIQSSE
jgi:hypothetical protein